MSQLNLTKTRLFEGAWEGVLRYDQGNGPEPSIDVTFREQTVSGVTIEPDTETGSWTLRVPDASQTPVL